MANIEIEIVPVGSTGIRVCAKFYTKAENFEGDSSILEGYSEEELRNSEHYDRLKGEAIADLKGMLFAFLKWRGKL